MGVGNKGLKSRIRTFHIRNKWLTISFIVMNILVSISLTIWSEFILYMFGDLSLPMLELYLFLSTGLLLYWNDLNKEFKEIINSEWMELFKRNGYMDPYDNTIRLSITLTIVSVLFGIYSRFINIDSSLSNLLGFILLCESSLYFLIIKYKAYRFQIKIAEKNRELSRKEITDENTESTYKGLKNKNREWYQ